MKAWSFLINKEGKKIVVFGQYKSNYCASVYLMYKALFSLLFRNETFCLSEKLEVFY